jgi:3-oxoacyl-[acyl-carrier-protein] synthase II
MRRVVITGLGIVSPLGCGVSNNWESLISGKSGISKITKFDVSDIAAKIAGIVPRGDEIGKFNPNSLLSPKEQRKLSDFIIYALSASADAVKDAGIDDQNSFTPERTGVIIGSGIGGLDKIEETTLMMQEKGAKRVSPFFIPASLINLASGQVSIKHGFRGPNHSVVTACATGSHAIGDAYKIIERDDADIMIAGGSEAAVCRVGYAGFAAARALSTSYNETPETASRPWDQTRDGFVMGEGSGILVLEEYEHAKQRNAKIYGEIIGYGMSGDAFHITSPEPEGSGAYNAMQAAFKDAKINKEQIDYINAHGTSTPVGDQIELNTIRKFFKDIDNVTMSSTKSSIGHLLGAAGSVEAIFCLLAMQDSLIPPTLNLTESIDNLGIDLVPLKTKEKNIKYALSNSFGFGGTNASLIFKKI